MKWFTQRYHAGQHVDVYLDNDTKPVPATIHSVYPTMLEIVIEYPHGSRVRLIPQEQVARNPKEAA